MQQLPVPCPLDLARVPCTSKAKRAGASERTMAAVRATRKIDHALEPAAGAKGVPTPLHIKQ